MRGLLGILVVVAVVPACGSPAETPALGCDQPLLTDLGHVSRDAPASFTTSGGRARFAVDDPDDGTVAVHVDRTTITLSGGAEAHEVEVDSKHPGTVDLPQGTYSVAVRDRTVTMATCPGTEISGVVPGVGTAHTSTPSPSGS